MCLSFQGGDNISLIGVDIHKRIFLEKISLFLSRDTVVEIELFQGPLSWCCVLRIEFMVFQSPVIYFVDRYVIRVFFIGPSYATKIFIEYIIEKFYPLPSTTVGKLYCLRVNLPHINFLYKLFLKWSHYVPWSIFFR